ncbi:hypothetical protein ACF1GY_01425 [Streptomyces sp. NPDC014684]
MLDNFSPHLTTKHKAQGSVFRRYVIWRNKHATDERPRNVVNRASIA